MGIQLPLKRGTAPPPTFRPMSIWPNGWTDQDATWYGGRPRPMPLCDRWGPSPRKGHSSPPLFGSCLLRPNDRRSQLLLSTCYPVRSKLHYGLSRKTSSPRLKHKTTTIEGGRDSGYPLPQKSHRIRENISQVTPARIPGAPWPA